jgi:DNA-directed RNA polymerase specialized sigma24 family protein
VHPVSAGLRDVELRTAVRDGDLDRVVALLAALYGGLLLVRTNEFGVPMDDVDDVIQDAFARLVEGWPTFDGQNVVGWLLTLLDYELLTYARDATRRGRVVRALDRVARPPADELVDPVAYADTVRLLAAIRDGLDGPGQAIFDALGQGITDQQLQGRILVDHGQELTIGAICNRRSRLRELVMERLAAEAVP